MFETLVLRKLERIHDVVKDIKAKQNALVPAGSIVSLNIPGLPSIPLASVADVEKFSDVVREDEANNPTIVRFNSSHIITNLFFTGFKLISLFQGNLSGKNWRS